MYCDARRIYVLKTIEFLDFGEIFLRAERAINRYQIHQTIGNESRLSLFIGQQSDEYDIKDIGHNHEG